MPPGLIFYREAHDRSLTQLALVVAGVVIILAGIAVGNIATRSNDPAAPVAGVCGSVAAGESATKRAKVGDDSAAKLRSGAGGKSSSGGGMEMGTLTPVPASGMPV